MAIGASGTVWVAAMVGEVNPLHLLLVPLLVHRSLVREARPGRVDPVTGGLLLGSAVGNLTTTTLTSGLHWVVDHPQLGGITRRLPGRTPLRVDTISAAVRHEVLLYVQPG